MFFAGNNSTSENQAAALKVSWKLELMAFRFGIKPAKGKSLQTRRLADGADRKVVDMNEYY